MRISDIIKGLAALGTPSFKRDAAGNAVGLVANGIALSLAQIGLNRPPRVTDNATTGYGAQSVWKAGGELYAPTVAPDSNSAMWQKIESVGGGCFTDVATAANTIFAGGTIAMKAGYTGAAIDIKVPIASVGTAFTINILASGELDNVALRAVMGRADAGSMVTCTKLYDQSGAGNHYAENVSYPCPYISWDALLGRYCLQFDGKTTNPRILQAPSGTILSGTGPLNSGFGVTGNAFTVAVYGRGSCCSVNSGNLATWSLGDMLNATVADRRFLCPFGQTSGEYQLWRTGAAVVTSPKVSVDLNPCITITSGSTTTVRMSVNEDAGTATVSNDTAVYTSGYLGSYIPAASGRAAHRVVGFAVANICLSAAQQTAIRYGAYQRLDIRPQVLDQIFCIGDSRTASALPLALRYDSYPLQLADRIGKAARVYGCGNDNMTSAQMLTTSVAYAVAKYRAGVRNTAIVLCGVNDIIVNNQTPAQSLVDIKANCLALKNAGFRVILIAELACTTTANSVNTQLPTLRGLEISAGAAAMNADVLLTPTQFACFATPATAAYYADGLHPTHAADAVLASYIVPSLELA